MTRARASLGAMIVAAVVISCGAPTAEKPASAAPLPAEAQKIVAAATGEGRLTLMWSAGLLDAPDELRRQAEGFNALYKFNFNVNVAFTPGPPMAEMTATIIRELQAGRPAPTDVILADEGQISALVKANAVEPVLWTTWAPNIRDLKLVTPGGAAVQVQTRIPGITYSTRLTGADVPSSLADLLRARVRGRVATTPDGANFDHLGSPSVWGPAKTLDYLGQLTPQLTRLINCGQESGLETGEFDAFVYDCGSNRAEQLKRRGGHVEWALPKDGAFVGYYYLAVPRKAPHPNAAKLWINYMLGRAAQDLMFEYDLADLHLLPGSHTFAEVDRYTKQGARFFELTVEFIQSEENKGLSTLRPKIQTILQRSVPFGG